MIDKVDEILAPLEAKSEDEIAAIMEAILAKTEAEQLEWATRVMKLESWRWVAGMSTTDRELVCSVAPNGVLRVFTLGKRLEERMAEACIPNFLDPMTVLALINVVRIAFPARDFVVQFPAAIPFHDLAHSLVVYLEDEPVAEVVEEPAAETE